MDIINIISSVGFPIACCCYLIYAHNKENEKTMEQMDKMRETIDNNTKVMYALCHHLDVNIEDLNEVTKHG